jgi:hypothetical protein
MMPYLLSLCFWLFIALGTVLLELSNRVYTGAIGIKLALASIGVYALYMLEQLNVVGFFASLLAYLI